MKLGIGEDWPFGMLTLLVGTPIVGVLLYLFYDAFSQPGVLARFVLLTTLGAALGLAWEWVQKRRLSVGGDDTNG